jgi:DNA-binding NtrC family response regulator
MQRVLMAWVGNTDLKAGAQGGATELGPIAQVLKDREFDRVVLLSNYPDADAKPYAKWLGERTDAKVELFHEKLPGGPTNYGEIYAAALRQCERVRGTKPEEVELTFHLSPGTPAMGAVWLLLGKTRIPAKLIESSKQAGVRDADVPFDIAAEFIPELLRERDERLREQSAGAPPTAPEFEQILHHSPIMERLVQRARRVAIRNVPVLIEGESGTGKELFARAIHRASPRRAQPFVAINCGAIPENLIESELFGHKKGAFSGASENRAGHFEEADDGTLFLDEVGELPAPVQVKLLRALQEGEVTRIGESSPRKVNVRILAATHRTLTDEIAAGRFREDLFFRLAVAVLRVPPLRERSGDLNLLIDHLLALVNREAAASEPGYRDKKLSAGARNLLQRHPWPGNVRELLNTLQRAAIWSDGPSISTEDAREAILPTMRSARSSILDRPLGDGLDLRAILNEVAKHYLDRAIAEAHGNKTKAAELIGMPSYQTLTNWLKRHGVQA